MDKWWLEEPYVSRILDEVEIQKSGGQIKFTLTKCRNNECEPIALVKDADKVLGDDLLHCICDWFLDYCAEDEGYDWERNWGNLPDGVWIINIEHTPCLLDQSVFDGHYLREIRPNDIGAVAPMPALVGFPRFWELFGFLLPRKTREQIFTPAYHDLLADHLRAQQARFQTRCARHWIRLCFTLRTVGLVTECLVVTVKRGVCLALMLLIPTGPRDRIWDWWCQLFRW